MPLVKRLDLGRHVLGSRIFGACVPGRPAGRPRDKSRRRSSTAQKLARFQLTAVVIMESIAPPAWLPGITAARTMRPVS